MHEIQCRDADCYRLCYGLDVVIFSLVVVAVAHDGKHMGCDIIGELLLIAVAYRDYMTSEEYAVALDDAYLCRVYDVAAVNP